MLNGRPVGAVVTVAFVAPMPGHWSRPAVTLKSALPIARGPITFVAPNAPCPPWKGKAVRLGSTGGPPLLEYAEPRAPSLLDVSGTVVLEALIAQDGTVTQVKPLREVEGLTDATVDAVKTWRFARTCFAGQSMPVNTTIALTYRIDSRAVLRERRVDIQRLAARDHAPALKPGR